MKNLAAAVVMSAALSGYVWRIPDSIACSKYAKQLVPPQVDDPGIFA